MPTFFQRTSDGFEFAIDEQMTAQEYEAAFGVAVVELQSVTPVEMGLADKRSRASLAKSDFLVAAVNAGFLTTAEAKAVNAGVWPASFSAALSGLSQAEQDEAEIRFGATERIPRLHPYLLAAASAIGATDADLDALFGIV